MPKVYRVENRLKPLADGIRDALLNRCKPGERIAYLSKSVLCRFEFSMAAPAEGGAPDILAEGTLGQGLFSFRSGAAGDVFSCSYYDDAEDTFHQFALAMASFRKPAGFRPPYIDTVYGIDAAALAPVGPSNYVPYNGAESRRIRRLLRDRFAGLCIREICGKSALIVYNENSPVREGFCERHIPACQKLAGGFKALYNAAGATLVFVRTGNKQFAFFYAANGAFFHCTEDGSALFLKREAGYLAGLLQITPDYALRGDKNPFPARSYEYRETDGGFALFVDGKETEMRIAQSFAMKGSLAARGAPGSLRAVWFAQGGGANGDGKKTMRQYASIDAAFTGELERALAVPEGGLIFVNKKDCKESCGNEH